jgi:hypothetical protein
MLADITLTNDDWWTAADALRAFSPPDDALANVIEGNLPARGTDPTVLTTILGMTDPSQESLLLHLSVTPPPIFNAKIVASTILHQIQT